MSHLSSILRNGGNSFTEKAKVKTKGGIFPASVTLTADLHSMGQFIQDGAKIMFETVLNVEKPACEIILEEEPVDLDD